MPHNRYFLDTSFENGKSYFLIGDEAHHLAKVMRKKEGESVELVNGKNQFALAKIKHIKKREVQLEVVNIKLSLNPIYSIILCQALPRQNRLDYILEKGTELGMTEIWLFPGELSEKSNLSAAQRKRGESILIASMKQCGRLDLPKIKEMPPLFNWDQKLFLYPSFFGDLSPQAPKFSEIFKKNNGILFFNGPEPGFSQSEKEILKNNSAQGVSLHLNTLRSDTAALTALALIANLI